MATSLMNPPATPSVRTVPHVRSQDDNLLDTPGRILYAALSMDNHPQNAPQETIPNHRHHAGPFSDHQGFAAPAYSKPQQFKPSQQQFTPQQMYGQQHLAPAPQFEMDHEHDGDHSGLSLEDSGFIDCTPQIDPELDDSQEQLRKSSAFSGKRRRPREKQATERELRQMFEQSRDRELQDIADELSKDEKGPQAERLRQMYAMNWLAASCRADESKAGKVTRLRVYNTYQQAGNIHGNKPLNPASFGKLVRIVFPNVQTRRLGNRGNSRYHYCGLSLNGHSESRDVSPEPEHSLSSYPRIPPPLGDRGVSPERSASGSRNQSPGLQTDLDSDEVTLPSLSRYVPEGTEKEFVQSLQVLLQSHYTLLKKYLRHMQLDNFFDLFKQLYGLMTLPVRKMLVLPGVVEWLQVCDLSFYEHMIRMMSQLALQAVPESVIAGLRKIRDELVPTIETAFKPYPPQVLAAKVSAAKHFTRLFSSLIRVNAMAHSATIALQTLTSSDPVYRDWGRFIDPLKTLQFQEPSCDHLEELKVVIDRMFSLLLNNESADSTDTVLDPWTAMLADLPNIFPDTSYEGIKTCISDLTQAISGDLLGSPIGQSVHLDWSRLQMLILEFVRFEAEQVSLSSQLMPSVNDSAIDLHLSSS